MGSHDHHHHSPHEHHHGTRNIKVAFWINFLFCLLELAGGIYTNSIAILSDALHDLGDSFSLGLAWYFQKLSSRKRDEQFSYGYKRFSLLGALINSLILLAGSIVVLREAIPRILSPQHSDAKGIIVFAVIGVIVNGWAVLKLQKGVSINEKVISLHLIEDVLGWVAVLISGLVMLFVDVPILDPILSIGITLYILYNVYHNLKSSLTILLQAVPMEIDEEEIKQKLVAIPAIMDVHDLHIWSLDGIYNVLSIHLVLKDPLSMDEVEKVKKEARSILQTLNIHHITIETESSLTSCALKHC